MFYYLAGQITQKSKSATEKYYVLNQLRIRTYPSQMSPSIIINDYTSSIRYNGRNPVIVGKCNISNEAQSIVLSKALAKPDMSYDYFKNYMKYFTDGFVVSASALTEEKLMPMLADYMKPIGAKVLWRIGYTE
jgi:pantothenate kinase